jgi:MYXO-CTERM domain-containing protein
MRRLRPLLTALPIALACLAPPRDARAELPVQRTFLRLSSSNGHGALMLDLSQARLTHFREHLFATEEPQLDANGQEVWVGNQPQVVLSRDLLYDAYFGLRANGAEAWLTGANVDLDASGYVGWKAGAKGGTGVVALVQKAGSLVATTYAFAPRGLAHPGMVMALRVQNTGNTTATGVSVFSLHNFHLGFGRPGVMNDIGAEGETIAFDGSGGKADLLERAFAGVLVGRALGAPAHHGASSSQSPPGTGLYAIVNAGGVADLPDLNGTAPTADDSVSGFQWDLGDLPPGGEGWAGVAFAHHGDPFAGATVQSWLDAYVGGQGAKALVDAEVAGWASFQGSVAPPKSAAGDDEALVRHAAALLAMAQVGDDGAFLREYLTKDFEPRYTRFGATLGAPPLKLPGTVAHRGKGAVIASLPPGEWTYAWARDGAYAAAAMATLGMKDAARQALSYTLAAEAGRFQGWNELKPYSMPPYQVSLVRYQGFGVEETDLNDYGPNLEFDGFGLYLWALRHYEDATGDETLVDGAWPVVSTKIADVLLTLIDPASGLVRPDSSIWETHWNGRQRTWTYTNVTAVRGLCDAAALAPRVGDAARAQAYHDAAVALRSAIAAKLLDGTHALVSNEEELKVGNGYWDAAVLDGIALGLFDPKGIVAAATLAGLDAHLAAPAGAGWSRNDDRTDHAGDPQDLSPWGSEYDSAEWVFTDMRGAVAARLGGDDARADRLIKWVREQSLANYMAFAETYDESTGVYKFNAPMIGFGAGAFTLALAAAGAPADPACGAYFDESIWGGAGGAGGAGTGGTGAGGAGGAGTGGTGAGGAGGTQGGGGTHGTAGSGHAGGASGSGGAHGTTSAGGASAGWGGAAPAGSAGAAPSEGKSGCGCRTAGGEDGGGWAIAAAGLALAIAARRRRG